VRSLASLAWRSLAARRLRTLLTVLGVALGVAVLFATQATNATLDAAVDRTVHELVGRADLRVDAFAETGLSGASLDAIRAAPGVKVVAPSLQRRTFLVTDVGPAGDPVTVLGIDPATDRSIRDLSLVRGVDLAPDTLRSVLVTESLAKDRGLDLGSTVVFYGAAAPIEFRVIGVVAGDGPIPAAFGRTAWIAMPAAQDLFGTTSVTSADVTVARDTTTDAVAASLESAITSEPYVLVRPAEIAAGLRDSTADIRTMLALVAAVVLFVGAFLIFNTLSMTVAERVREVGLLRAAGATRRQVGSLFLVQGVIVGVAGSVLGVLAGVVLAAVVVGLLHRVEGLTVGGITVLPADLAFALALGTLVTAVAASEPAWRASRLSPVEALRSRMDPSVGMRAQLRWLVVVAVVVGIGGIAVLPGGVAAGIGLLGPVLVYAILLVAALASPWLLRPLGRLAAIPFGWVFRTETRLMRGVLTRDPARTALTVGALAIGLAMVVAVASVGALSRSVASAWISDVVPGSTVVSSIRPIAADEGVADELAAIAGVATVTPVGTFDVALQPDPAAAPYRVPAAAVSGAAMLADGRLTFVTGDRASALGGLDAGGTAILPRSLADRLRIGVGDPLRLGFGDAVTTLAVTGVVEHTFPAPDGETALVSWADASARLGVAGADFYAIRYGAGAPGDVAAQVASVARELALQPTSLDEIRGQAEGAVGRLFGLFDAIAIIAVIIAGFGIVNTMTMSVVERVREIGVLRATGLTRAQTWRMVMVESGILGVAGAIIGVVTGLAIGAVMLVTQGGRLAWIVDAPWLTIVAIAAAGVVVAMLAAAYPARVASRVNIVRAVRGE
jgi:putative ABC transport system permease protein